MLREKQRARVKEASVLMSQFPHTDPIGFQGSKDPCATIRSVKFDCEEATFCTWRWQRVLVVGLIKTALSVRPVDEEGNNCGFG